MRIENNLELLNMIELIREDQHELDSLDSTLYERIFVFSSLGVHFGVFHQHVVEILRAKEFIIYKVPRTSVDVLGMINLRGDIIPILDFKKRFLNVNCTLLGEDCSSLDQIESTKSQRIIIVNAKEIKFGLMVEHVIGIMSVLKASFKEEYTPMIEFTVESSGIPTYVLKLDELF